MHLFILPLVSTKPISPRKFQLNRFDRFIKLGPVLATTTTHYHFKIVSSCLSSYAIQYKELGDPSAVLEKVQHEVSESLQSNEIAVKMLASPVNPADINMIQGKYGKKPKLPAIGGYEGVAKVVKVGSSVKNLQVGSWVIPIADNDGVWKHYGVYTEDLLIK
ncbi:Enoyl-[acyl-carrier-protein] reductase, mitochondrial, partial [Araneus ventricosus]